jgi:hypothetical protein
MLAYIGVLLMDPPTPGDPRASSKQCLHQYAMVSSFVKFRDMQLMAGLPQISVERLLGLQQLPQEPSNSSLLGPYPAPHPTGTSTLPVAKPMTPKE